MWRLVLGLVAVVVTTGCASRSSSMPPPDPREGPPVYTPPQAAPNVTGTMGGRPFVGRASLARQVMNGAGGGNVEVMVFERPVRCEEWHLYAAPPPNPLQFGEHAVEVTFDSLWPVFPSATFRSYPLAPNGTIDGTRKWEILVAFHNGEHYHWVRGEVTVLNATQWGGTLQFRAERTHADPASPTGSDPGFEGAVSGTVPFSICPPDPFPTSKN
jgi:hypothetical protein